MARFLCDVRKVEEPNTVVRNDEYARGEEAHGRVGDERPAGGEVA